MLGVQVVSDKSFTLDDPLAKRWLRYWPNPYGSFKTGTPFHDRLKNHPDHLTCTEKDERQELRLLYVGWTRARDKVVLAGREGFLQKGILRLLTDDKKTHLLESTTDEDAVWAGQALKIRTRKGKPDIPQQKGILTGSGYKAVGPKSYPPAFLSASGLSGQGTVTAKDMIGERIALTGQPDMQMLGEAIHTFLAADSCKRTKDKRKAMAAAILARWRVAHDMTPESLLTASDRLRAWIDKRWPQAIWRHEYPVSLRQTDGTIVSGFIDLLLETPEGFVIIDHKSFPGSVADAKKKAASFGGQLGLYAKAVQEATGKKIDGGYIHLPISGMMLLVQHVTTDGHRQ
jgi:ATP-dependent exoDNAse (exonuclease V) beta subunit